jgi:hypothetical protein
MSERQLSLGFGEGRAATRPEPARAVPERAADAPPAVLDRTMVSVVVLREVERAMGLYPDWAHPFAGLQMNRARRSYGQAHRDGRIVISKVFLGTGALADLEDTVRHEIAHLIVGIDERHGPRWRRVARRLGAVPRASGRSQAEDLGRRMDNAPYTLVAVLESGEECEIKTVFRRSRRYLEYRLNEGGACYRFRGSRVSRFIYRSRRGGD